MRRLLTLALFLLATPAFAKSIHWPEVNVTAHLDAEGRLRVREEQRTVFDGDWNGGERGFNLRRQQSIEITRVLRKDGAAEILLERGNIDQVDHYDMFDSTVLRWRSRLPGDPAFENKELTYVIEYVLSDILTEVEGDVARLDHDFLTADRPGDVDQFTLQLTFDPAWQGRPVSIERGPIPPGQTVIVTQDLAWRGSGSMPVDRPAPFWVGLLIVIALLAGIAFLVIRFMRAERKAGRLDPLPAADENWIEEHVATMRPELVSAAFRGRTGADAVGAMLARMTQEGKLISTVVDGELHLRRTGDGGLLKYENDLLTKLFFGRRNETSTDAIEKHYKGTGFDPAAVIAPQLEADLGAIPGWTQKNKRVPWLFNLSAIFGSGIVMIVAGFIGGGSDLGMAAIGAFFAVFFAVFACAIAAANARSLTRIPLRLGIVLAILAPLVAFAALCALSTRSFGLHAPVLAMMALLYLAFMKLALDLLLTPESRQRIAVRKKLLAARAWFIEQLGSAQPRLRDEWLPYLIALGLGSNVDRWFRAHGVPATETLSRDWSTSSSTASPSSATSVTAPQWTGGGGRFGGAGATGSWVAAAGVMAAGVSSPSTSSSGSSSSSSSSSSSGSSSSGGGSMGGW